MSSWHQNQGSRTPLWHDTKWTVVCDPPGRTLSVERVITAKEAIEKGSRPHCYALPPNSVNTQPVFPLDAKARA